MNKTETVGDLIGSVKELESKTVSVFEELGQIIERVESTSNYRFDKFNNLIESNYSVSDKYTQKTISKFDSQNRLIESLLFLNDLLKQKIEFSYDSKDRVVEKKYSDENNNLQNTHCPVYTKDDLRIEEVAYEPLFSDKNSLGSIFFTIAPEITVQFNSENIYKSKAIYNADNKLLKISFYNHGSKLKKKLLVIYDSDKNPFQSRKFGDTPLMLPVEAERWKQITFPLVRKIFNFYVSLQTFYKLALRGEFKKIGQCFIYGTPYEETNFLYDGQKKLVGITNFSTFFDGHRKIFKYDEKGNKSEETLYAKGDLISHFESHEYNYDAQNNWIKRKTLYKIPMNVKNQTEERTVMTYRKIQY